MPSIDDGRDILTAVLLDDDPRPGLWELVDTGLADDLVPELPALKLEQDPIHRHKDVLAHTIAVTAQTRADLTLRLSALFHDVGKPHTRSYEHGGVTFRHHEAVGAKMTKKRLRALEFPAPLVKDVAELVRLSGRFKGYADGWSDAAVRRYARDAGHLLGLLNELVRADCTTRNERKRVELREHVDHLQHRINELAEADRRAAERPLIDGDAVMARLGLGPGPDIGAALRFLLELKRDEPDLDLTATEARLDAWWAERRAPTA
ncbi:MAG: HDIG domain-containing protein [Acidimicrobiia bacterium]|nr:HDIG domain-containing protein [Acidimicrobiia bacterium]